MYVICYVILLSMVWHGWLNKEPDPFFWFSKNVSHDHLKRYQKWSCCRCKIDPAFVDEILNIHSVKAQRNFSGVTYFWTRFSFWSPFLWSLNCLKNWWKITRGMNPNQIRMCFTVFGMNVAKEALPEEIWQFVLAMRLIFKFASKNETNCVVFEPQIFRWVGGCKHVAVVYSSILPVPGRKIPIDAYIHAHTLFYVLMYIIVYLYIHRYLYM